MCVQVKPQNVIHAPTMINFTVFTHSTFKNYIFYITSF